MKELLISVFDFFGWAWWVKIVTQNPSCTYYFGPFLSDREALDAKGGYLEDLFQEGATGIDVTIERCQPTNLTVFDDLGERSDCKKASQLLASGHF